MDKGCFFLSPQGSEWRRPPSSGVVRGVGGAKCVMRDVFYFFFFFSTARCLCPCTNTSVPRSVLCARVAASFSGISAVSSTSGCVRGQDGKSSVHAVASSRWLPIAECTICLPTISTLRLSFLERYFNVVGRIRKIRSGIIGTCHIRCATDVFKIAGEQPLKRLLYMSPSLCM